MIFCHKKEYINYSLKIKQKSTVQCLVRNTRSINSGRMNIVWRFQLRPIALGGSSLLTWMNEEQSVWKQQGALERGKEGTAIFHK